MRKPMEMGILVQLSVLMLKNNILESQGGWNEGSTTGSFTRGIGVKWLKT
ncbi:hypothetical protein SUSAZ_08760 [Sulfolobus acidocaldarius SUSAZ]|nr:hypothetical protein SUSAZ_08760 [Sulfolobus acidocaldarius SUSAZ]